MIYMSDGYSVQIYGTTVNILRNNISVYVLQNLDTNTIKRIKLAAKNNNVVGLLSIVE